MLKNLNVRRESNKLLVELPWITEGLSNEEIFKALNELVTGSESKVFTNSKGDTTYYYVSSATTDGNRGKYHSLVIDGIEARLSLDFVITSDVIDSFNPSKAERPKQSKVKKSMMTLSQAEEMIKKGYLTKEDITEMLKDGRIEM